MWTIEEGSITLEPGLNTYPLPVDTIDLLDQVTRTNAGTGTPQIDININRIRASPYSTIPNKYAQGRPIQVWINRQTAATDSTSATTVATTAQATDTTIYLANVNNLPAAGFVKIDSEIINYSYISGNTLYNCFRGQNNTTAATHTAGASILQGIGSAHRHRGVGGLAVNAPLEVIGRGALV